MSYTMSRLMSLAKGPRSAIFSHPPETGERRLLYKLQSAQCLFVPKQQSLVASLEILTAQNKLPDSHRFFNERRHMQ
jgi:hypothetical protein